MGGRGLKALVFDRPGAASQVLRILDVPEPAPGPEDVLVEIKASAVMQSDYMFVEGRYRWEPALPQIAGLEGVGRVVAIGARVDETLGLNLGAAVVFRHPGWGLGRIPQRSSIGGNSVSLGV